MSIQFISKIREEILKRLEEKGRKMFRLFTRASRGTAHVGLSRRQRSGRSVMKGKSAEFRPARSHAELTSGETIRMLRELKGWTQIELAERCSITATNISLLENGHVEIGKRRALQLAEAFGIHPAIIMFPEYESEAIRRAA